jgi:hypothetical protein
MKRLEVFDPPMCCSTGVCGPTVDPVLLRFAADLHWLVNQGVAVERYNLAQQAQAFAANPLVKGALREHGNKCLPLLLLDGAIATQGGYPTRAELAALAGVEFDPAAPSEPAHSKGAALPVIGNRNC